MVGDMETERDKWKNQRRQTQRGVVPSPPEPHPLPLLLMRNLKLRPRWQGW